MRVRVSAGAMSSALGPLQRVVSRKQTIPELSGVLARPGGAGLVLTATALDVTLQCEVECDASGGTALLPGERLYGLLRTMQPDTPVDIERKGSKVSVRAAGLSCSLQAFDPDAFPALPEAPPGGEATVGRDETRLMLGLGRLSVPGAATRTQVYGMRLEVAGGLATAVSTDSARLSCVSVPCGGADQVAATVPGMALAEVASLVEGDGSDLRYSAQEGHLYFASGGRAVWTRVVDVEFPSYRRVIPDRSTLATTVVAPRMDLLGAVRRVDVVSDRSRRAVEFRVAGGSLSVASESQEAGQAAESVEARCSGPDATFKLQARFVSDYLAAAPGADVVLATDGKGPACWYPPDGGPDSVYIVMPVRL